MTDKEQNTPTDPRDPEFWKDAPEGATHWGVKHGAYVGGWYSETGAGVWFWLPAENTRKDRIVWNGPLWRPHHPEDLLIPRPELENPEWDGEGLPPVGTVCEFSRGSWCPWGAVEVIGHYKGRVAHVTETDFGPQVDFGEPSMYRPLRSHRERVIDEAMSVASPYIDSRATAEKMAGALYDAGMLHLPESDHG